MVNAARAMCPRCGAPISSDEPAGLCPRCLLSDTQGGQSEHLPISQNNTTRFRWPPGNAGSAGNGEVRQCSRPGPRSDLKRSLHELKGGKCPICKGPGPIDVRRSHVAWSIAFVPFWSSLTLVCCHSCGIRLRLGAIAASVLFGLWGIPFCWIIPPLIHSWELGWMLAPLGLLYRLNTINFFVQVARNLKGVLFAPAGRQIGHAMHLHTARQFR